MQFSQFFFRIYFSPVLHGFAVHLLPRDHRPLRHHLQAILLAAVAARLHLPRQPPPVLPRQLRLQHRILGHCELMLIISTSASTSNTGSLGHCKLMLIRSTLSSASNTGTMKMSFELNLGNEQSRILSRMFKVEKLNVMSVKF